MNEVGTLSLNGCDITNKDTIVTYVPNAFVTNYQYIILKDDVEINKVSVDDNSSSNIILNQSGNYRIKIIAHSNTGYNTFITDTYKIDKEKPIIKLKKDVVNLKTGTNYDIYSNISVTDKYSNDDVTIQTNIDEIDLSKSGKQTLVYTVSDTAGNISTKDVTLNINSNNYLLSISQIIIIGILVCILIFLLILDKSVRLEKRFLKYTVSPLKDHTKSFFDRLSFKLDSIIYNISNSIDRFESINRLSKRYNKYTNAFSNGKYSGVDFVSMKIIVGFLSLIFSIIIQTLRFKLLNIFELVIPFVVGFYILDIIYAYRYYKYRKRIEKDLLQAIIIMNNCFKSGRSITQAVNLVSQQLEGAIADEFKKMSLEISFGLDIEEVFKRFANRIKLEEAAYLTSSLSVLNKTGGNIIKVFTSIEKTLFSRQKLNLELKSLTGSSKLIMYVLTVMPILFILLITLINKDYFDPLFQSALGFVIIGLIIILYISYIFVVRKIMKVRV